MVLEEAGEVMVKDGCGEIRVEYQQTHFLFCILAVQLLC